jgi:hypothetical protein
MRAPDATKAPIADDRQEGRSKAAASRGPGLGREIPRMPRRYGQWAGAVLFVVVSVLIAGWLWQQKSDRVEILSVADAVPAGEVITAKDLEIVEVAGLRDGIPAANVDSVVGRTALVGLVEGQVLTPGMLTTTPVPAAGERVVGLQLEATRTPYGLAPGDVVVVVAVPPSGDPSAPEQLDEPEVLAETATVASSVPVEGAGTRLTLVVPQEVATRVAGYAAAGRVALVQAPIGGDD